MKKLIIGALMALCASLTFAAPSVKQVEEVISNSDYVAAEAMLNQVLKEHPDSAKAHYYLGQIKAKHNKIADAQFHFAQQSKIEKANGVIAEKVKAQQLAEAKKQTDNLFRGLIVFFVGCFIALVAAGIAIHYRNKRKQQAIEDEEIRKENLSNAYAEKQRNARLKHACELSEKLETLKLNLKLNNPDSSDLVVIENLLADSIDLIEILHKNGEVSETAIRSWFHDAETVIEKVK